MGDTQGKMSKSQRDAQDSDLYSIFRKEQYMRDMHGM
jgi:hypothetical protein